MKEQQTRPDPDFDFGSPWLLFISHHFPKDYDRCFIIHLGKMKLPVCSRCIALYPTMLALLILQFTLLKIPQSLDPLFIFIFPLPAFVEWGLRKANAIKSSNVARVITGILFGAGLSRGFYYYLRNPLHPLAWAQGLYFLICFSLIYLFLRARPKQV